MADTLIASGSLAQVQTHLSLVAGTSFADLQGVNLGLYLGNKLVVWDSAMRPASAYPVAAGTGETLDTEQFVNGNFASNEPPGSAWTRQAGWTIAGGYGVALTAASTYMYQTAATRSGGLIKLVFDLVTVTSNGVRPALTNLGGTLPLYSSPQSGITTYATMAGGVYSIGFFANTSFSGTVGNAHAAYVLTPSIMGVIVSSNPTGTPGDAWSIAPNFNRNDSSGYTWAILSESSSIMYSFPEDKTQIDRRPRNKAYAEPFVNFQSPGSAPIWLAPVLVDDIRKHTNLKAFSRAYYEPWGQFQPPVSAPRLPLTADVSDKTAHTNRKVPRAYFDFASKAPTQKDGNINPSPQASGRYRGWASNWAIGVKEDFPWS